MEWITPVTNKNAESYVNVADIKRLATNLDFVCKVLKIGASVAVPEGFDENIQRLKNVTTKTIIYKEDFVWINSQIAYFVEKYNQCGPDTITVPVYSNVSFSYLNEIERFMDRFKTNLSSKWLLQLNLKMEEM